MGGIYRGPVAVLSIPPDFVAISVRVLAGHRTDVSSTPTAQEISTNLGIKETVLRYPQI